MRFILPLIGVLLNVMFAFSVRHDPYNRSRIYWDTSSQTTIFSVGNYGRVIQLQDGRLMAVCEGGGVKVSYSSDLGATWSSAGKLITNPSNIQYAVPDLIQLSDGTIIVGYNPRPTSPYSEERKFGIRCLRSTDGGTTWSNPIFIYDASYLFNDGCWEPSFLELPSGEVQCYFADEGPYTSSSEQCISMCRSFDKGLTWSNPIKVSFRANSRDGMPVPVLTKDGKEIVVIIEDNGWGRSSFAATTVRTTLENNWSDGYVKASSANRSMIFETIPATSIISAAPYLRVLPSGETVASYMGNEERGSDDNEFYDMFVEVGDSSARNFKARTQPFNLAVGKHSKWNSVAVVDTGIVLAIGSIGTANVSGRSVQMMKGYPKKGFCANYGTPVIDGSVSKETWTCDNGKQVFMGYKTHNRTTADFLYDNDNLYFSATVVDRNIYTTDVDPDGIELFIDTKNVCDTYPQEGCFRFFFNTNGTVKVRYGKSNKWVLSSDTLNIQYKVNKALVYYVVEAAIPWKSLGYETAPIDNEMRVTLELSNRSDSAIETEVIPDAESLRSWTWPEFQLNKPNNTAIKEYKDDTDTILLNVSDDCLTVSSQTKGIRFISLYSVTGVLLVEKEGNHALVCTVSGLSRGVKIVRVVLSSGKEMIRKVIV